MSKCYLLLREWEQRIPRRQSPQIRYCHPELASVSWKLTTAPPTPRPPPRPCLSGRQTARHAARDARGLAGRAAAVGDGCRAWRPGARLRGPSPEAAARLSHHGMRTAGAAGSERHPRLLRSPKAPGARAWIPGHDDGIESRRPSGSRDHGPGRAVRSASARGGVSVSAGHPRGSSTPTQSPRPRPGQAGTSACPACPAWGSAVTMAGPCGDPRRVHAGPVPAVRPLPPSVGPSQSFSTGRGPWPPGLETRLVSHQREGAAGIPWAETGHRRAPAAPRRPPADRAPVGGCAHRVPRGPEGETGGAEGGAAVAGGPAT